MLHLSQISKQTTIRSSEAGFTLLEVLIALAITGITLGTLLSILNNSLYSYSNLRHKIIAQWVAEEKATELRLNPKLLANNDSKSNYINMLNHSWLVKFTINTTADPLVKQINITVFHANNTGRALVQLKSYGLLR